MTFTSIDDLRTYILATFTANGIRDITGPEAQDALIGILDLLNPSLKASLATTLPQDGHVGGINDGKNYAQGTSLEQVIRDLLTQVIPPTYNQPVVLLSSNVSQLFYEIGSVVSPTFSVSFTQNDAGISVSSILQKNGSTISSFLPYQDASVVLDGSDKAYQAFVNYAQGACKTNSASITDCTGRIQAGTKGSNIITYSSFRKCFFGTPVITIGNSSDVRGGLSSGFLNPQEGSQFNINIPAGSVRVAFAYPATLRDVSSVKYQELAFSEVKGNFTKSLIMVEGANSYTAAQYKVFIYEPIEPFSQTVNYQVTI